MDKMVGIARPSWRSKGDGYEDRRMSLLQRAGLFSNDTQGAKVTRAASLEDLTSAYRLVHDVFVQRGYIVARESGLRVRVFEALPETATFVAKAEEQVVAVTTVIIDSPDLGLPSDIAFKAEIDTLRAHNRKICEGTNWLVAESHRHSAVMSELMRCSFAHSVAEGCTDFVGAVSPGHAKFFNLLGFEQIGEQKSYSAEIHDPVVLVRLDLSGLADRFRGVDHRTNQVERFLKSYYVDENPYHRFVGGWRVVSRRLFQDPLGLHELFVQKSSLLTGCSARQQEAIARRWGREVFERTVTAYGLAAST